MYDLAALATELVSQRVRRGVEIEPAARLAALDPEKLASAEAGEVALSEEELQRLADAYGIGVSAFFGAQTTPVSYLFGA